MDTIFYQKMVSVEGSEPALVKFYLVNLMVRRQLINYLIVVVRFGSIFKNVDSTFTVLVILYFIMVLNFSI